MAVERRAVDDHVGRTAATHPWRKVICPPGVDLLLDPRLPISSARPPQPDATKALEGRHAGRPAGDGHPAREGGRRGHELLPRQPGQVLSAGPDGVESEVYHLNYDLEDGADVVASRPPLAAGLPLVKASAYCAPS
jgi:hypothetical protein